MMWGAREDYGLLLSYFALRLVCVFVPSLDKILERDLFSFFIVRSHWLNVFVHAPSLQPPAEIGTAPLSVGRAPGPPPIFAVSSGRLKPADTE